MKYYILIYNYTENYLEKRTPFRSAHFEIAKKAVNNGYLLLGGATENPADSGFLVFKVPSKEIIESFIANDPYVQNKIVISWEIKEWNVVLGTSLAD